MTICQRSVTKMLDKLKDALANHDWYYHMSDSHAAYSRGRREATEISILMKTALVAGEGEQAAELFNEYNPNSKPAAFNFAEKITRVVLENGEFSSKYYTEEEWNER